MLAAESFDPRLIWDSSEKIALDTDGHSAAAPQPKEITPSLPSPLEGEG
jgi:hypothetical protein